MPLRSARLLLGLAALLFAANVIAQQTPAQALAAWEAQGRADGLARPDIECQDFLQAMGRKPAGLEYSGCSQDDASCIKPMQAHYRVPGTQAVKVEAYLRETLWHACIALRLLRLEQWRAVLLARRPGCGEVPDRHGRGIAAA